MLPRGKPLTSRERISRLRRKIQNIDVQIEFLKGCRVSAFKEIEIWKGYDEDD